MPPSPADLRKQGNYFDLPIALSVLAAAGFVRMDELENKIFIGELGLDGSVRPVNGTLVLAECGCNAGIKSAVVPQENSKEAGERLTVIWLGGSIFGRNRGLWY